MTQRLAWPVDQQRQEGGAILVSFPDIPEALTEGATETEALTQARDSLSPRLAAMSGSGARSPTRRRHTDGHWWRCRH